MILLNIKLTKLSGLEVLRRIRRDVRTHRVPIAILTTAYEQEEISVEDCLGPNSYIQQPVDFQKLATAAQQLGLTMHILEKPPG